MSNSKCNEFLKSPRSIPISLILDVYHVSFSFTTVGAPAPVVHELFANSYPPCPSENPPTYWNGEPASSPTKPYDPRNFRLEMNVILFLKNDSSEIRHPPDTTGKKPQL